MSNPNWSMAETWNDYYSGISQMGRDDLLQELTTQVNFDQPIKEFLDRELSGITDGVLDVGAGSFSFSYLDPAIKSTQVDFSAEASFLRLKNTTPAVANAASLPFAPETFRAVISKETYGYQPDPGKMLQEMVRVLIPGGKFILIDSEVNGSHDLLNRANDVDSGKLSLQLSQLGIKNIQIHRLKRISADINGQKVSGFITAIVGTK